MATKPARRVPETASNSGRRGGNSGLIFKNRSYDAIAVIAAFIALVFAQIPLTQYSMSGYFSAADEKISAIKNTTDGNSSNLTSIATNQNKNDLRTQDVISSVNFIKVSLQQVKDSTDKASEKLGKIEVALAENGIKLAGIFNNQSVIAASFKDINGNDFDIGPMNLGYMNALDNKLGGTDFLKKYSGAVSLLSSDTGDQSIELNKDALIAMKPEQQLEFFTDAFVAGFWNKIKLK